MRFCTKWQHSGKKGGKKDTKPGTSKKRFSRLNYDLNTKNKDGLDTKWQHSGKNGGKDFANTVLSNCSTCKTVPRNRGSGKCSQCQLAVMGRGLREAAPCLFGARAALLGAVRKQPAWTAHPEGHRSW